MAEASPAPRPAPPPLYSSPAGKARIAARYEQAMAAIPYEHEARLVPTSFGAAHVLVCGPAPAPPLVVWHGFGVPAPFLVRLFDAWVEQGRFRIYLPDHPYQAGSRSEDALLAPERHEHGQWALEVLRGLGLVPGEGTTAAGRAAPPPLHIGVSYGGAVLFDLAQVAPGAIGGAALLVSAGMSPGPMGSWVSLLRVILPSLLYRLLPFYCVAWPALASMCDEPSNPDLEMILLGWRHIANYAQLPGGNGGFSREQLARLAAPTLVVAAEHDIFAPGDAVAAVAQRALPDCRTTVIRGARHLPSRQRLGEARDAVLRFFTEKGLIGGC